MKKRMLALLAVSSFLFGCNDSLMTAPITPDSSWQSNTLENGFQTHIKEIPGEAVSLRLVIHTGSRDETHSQQGHAHFLEHMAFNGSASFPKNEVVKLFEAAGSAFGQHINAYTSHSSTVYQLDLPNNDTLPQALQWFREIATSLRLDTKDVDSEKGVVLGEIRQQNRVAQNAQYQIIMEHARQRYGTTSPVIGESESIRNLSSDELRRFYEENYTPDNTEIIITGAVNTGQLQQSISRLFGAWEAKEGSSERTAPAYSSTPYVVQAGDSEFPSYTLVYDLPPLAMGDGEDYAEYAASHVMVNGLNTRLNDRLRDTEIPVQAVSANLLDWFESPLLMISIAFEPQHQHTALDFLAKELATLRDHGLSELEVDAQTSSFIDQQTAFTTNWQAKEYANHRVYERIRDLAPLSAQSRQSLAEMFQTRVEASWLNKELRTLLEREDAQQYFAVANQDVLNDEKKMQVSTQLQAFQQTLAQAGKKLLLPTAIEDFPQPDASGDIVAIEQVNDSTTKWHLSNNVTLYLRTMPDAGDRLYVYTGSQGGMASLPADLRPAAYLAPQAYTLSGLGGLSSTEYNRLMVKSRSYLEPMLWENLHGFYAESPKDAFPLVLSSLYQAYQHAALDPGKFEQHKTRFISEQQQFADSIDGKARTASSHHIYQQDSVRYQLLPSSYANVTAADVERAYQALFQVNRGLTYVIAGDISVEEMKPLVRTYIAGMTFKHAEPGKAYSLNVIPEQKDFTLAFGPRGNNVEMFTLLSLPAEEKTTKDRFIADMASRIVTARLTEQVREMSSLDYSPTAFVDWPDGADTQQFFFIVNAEILKRDEARNALDKVVNSVGDGISEQEFSSTLKQLSHALADGVNLPQEQARMMFNYVLYGSDPTAVTNPETVLDALSHEEVDNYLKQFAVKTSKRLNITNLPSAN